MDERQAAELAARLLDAFPQTAVREGTTGIYERYLRDLEHAAASDAVDDLIAHATGLPAIAEIRREVIGAGLELPTALEAFASLAGRADLHPLVRRAAGLFGGSFNILNSDNPSISRAQFLKAYEELREEELRRANVDSFRGRRRQSA